MKRFLPLLSLVFLVTSCSTTYKSGQTPDDVYFSPARPVDDNVKSEDREEKYNKEENSYAYDDDRYLRLKIRNRDRWSEFDDYYRDPYAYTYKGCYCNCNYNPRLYWSNYYTPYGPKYVIYNPKTVVYSQPRSTNLHVFDNRGTTSTKQPSTQTKTYNTPSTKRTVSTDAGNTLRDIFRGSDNSSNSSSQPSKSSGSSSSSSSSSGSSSTNNGNAPVRKF
jgi:hypothetical protein